MVKKPQKLVNVVCELPLTLECLIQEHVRLFFLKKKSTLCALITHYSQYNNDEALCVY